MTTYLDDATWQRLDPHAGRLSRRTAAKTWLLIAVCLVAAGAAVTVYRSGLIVPRVVAQRSGGWGADSGAKRFRTHVVLRNDGVAAVEVLGVGRGGPGLEYHPVDYHFPLRLRPSAEMDFVLEYQVTDCAAV